MRGLRRAANWATARVGRLARWSLGRKLVAGAFGLAVGIWLLSVGVELYTEWLWFDLLGRGGVLVTQVATRLALFGAGTGLALAALLGNLALARRCLARADDERGGGDEDLWRFVARVSARLDVPLKRARRLGVALRVAAVGASIGLGLLAAGQWDRALRAWHAVPFGETEPLFGRDVGFYVFTLPALRAGLGWLWLLAMLASVGVALAYLAALRERGDLDFGPVARALGRRSSDRTPPPDGSSALLWAQGRPFDKPGTGEGESRPRLRSDALSRGAWAHLAGLGGVLLALSAGSHQVALAELVFSTRGQAAGLGLPGFADVQVQAPAYWAMTLAALVAAGLLVAAGRGRSWSRVALALAVYGVALLGGLAGPGLVYALVVRPNELELEQPYIAEWIQMTRRAYGLEGVEEQLLPTDGEASVPPAGLLSDLPLWSRAAMRDNLNQLQAFRPYYTFPDTDVDRYVVGGRRRLVMVAPREVDADLLPARTWVNTHLQFTHGHGVALALAGEVGSEGQPALVLRDLSLRGEPLVDRPELYFGERTEPYALVKTTIPEHDPTRAEGAASQRYEGRGIGIGAPLPRLAFALRLGDLNLLLSQTVTAETELLFRRQVVQRVAHLASFLAVDPDPYPVVADGRVLWLVNGYSTSADYPLSHWRLFGPPTPAGVAATGPRVNYVRHSVVGVVDAYDGTTRLFVLDPRDPIVATYGRAYPGLLEPLEQMPMSVREHLRYPRQLLGLQAEVLSRFHQRDPVAFYHADDVWRSAEEKFEARLESGPAYALLRLPGQEREELVLLQPFSPANNRHNLVALLVARSDPPNEGRLLLLRVPRERQLIGPLQVERRIEQDPSLAAQFGLWQRAGSLVIRGKLLTVPASTGPVYVEAVYLQRGVQPVMPQLQRVIVATGGRLAMESSVERAVARLSGAAGGGPQEVAGAARERLARAHEALAAGDRARYADEMAGLEAELRRLEEAERGR